MGFNSEFHYHHISEGLGVFPFPWSWRWSWSLHLFLGRPMILRPFGLYRSTYFGSLFVSILYTCCRHFFWYCFISFAIFCAPVFCLIHWFFSLSSFVIPSKCLKNFICAASKRCSSLFFSTQASIPNFSATLAVIKRVKIACISITWFEIFGRLGRHQQPYTYCTHFLLIHTMHDHIASGLHDPAGNRCIWLLSLHWTLTPNANVLESLESGYCSKAGVIEFIESVSENCMRGFTWRQCWA